MQSLPGTGPEPTAPTSAPPPRPDTGLTTEYEKAILRALPEGLLVVDEDGCLEFFNDAFAQMTGWTPAELLGHGMMLIVPHPLHRDMLALWNESQEHGKSHSCETDLLHRDGHHLNVLLSIAPLDQDKHRKTLLLIRDITGKRSTDKERDIYRERLEQKVHERTAALVEINSRLSRSEAALTRAQETAHIGSWEWYLDKPRPEWSREMFLLFGLPPGGDAPTWEQIITFIHPDDREQLHRVQERLSATQGPYEQEYRIVRKDGSVIEVLSRAQPHHSSFGNLLHVSGTMQDITERRQLERQIVEASQNEQQRIGHDLHDTLGQELTGISLLAKALEHQIRKLAPKQADGAAELSRLSGMAASHARSIAHGLSPVDIAEEGLSAELQRMSQRVSSLYGIRCVFNPIPDERVYDNAVATHLYHIAQEAVTNAIKHANLTEVTVALQGGNPGTLVVTNDQQGEQVPPTAPEERLGIGMRIMRHRADIIKAKLVFQHDPTGAKLICTFPNPPTPLKPS